MRPAGTKNSTSGILACGALVALVFSAIALWRIHPRFWSSDELVAWWENETDERTADLKLSYLVDRMEKRGDREGTAALVARAMTADLRLGAFDRFDRRWIAFRDALSTSPQFGSHLQAWIEELLSVGEMQRAHNLLERLHHTDSVAWGGVQREMTDFFGLTRELIRATDIFNGGQDFDAEAPVWEMALEYLKKAPNSSPEIRNGYFTRAGLGRRLVIFLAKNLGTRPDRVKPFTEFLREWTAINSSDPAVESFRQAVVGLKSSPNGEKWVQSYAFLTDEPGIRP